MIHHEYNFEESAIKFIRTLIIIPIFLIVLLTGCVTENNEAPFFDGLVLEYDVSNIKFVYKVYALEDNKFRIVKTEKWTGFREKIFEYFTDVHGIVYEVTRKASRNYIGGFSPIWISTKEMKIGDTFDGGEKVIERKQWKKWDVLVVKNPSYDIKRYYEVNTGFFVGLEARGSGGGSTETLINSNTEIPEI